MTPILTKSYVAAAAVAGHLFVKLGAGGATAAAAATDIAIGVSDKLGADAGGQLDVHHHGTYLVRAGGTIAVNDPLTADADGKAVKAVVTNATAVWSGAIALEAGVAGDLVRVLIIQAWLSKPAA